MLLLDHNWELSGSGSSSKTSRTANLQFLFSIAFCKSEILTVLPLPIFINN